MRGNAGSARRRRRTYQKRSRMKIVILSVSVVRLSMAKDTSDHRKKALLGASIVAVTLGIGYVLLAVFSVGLAIVGLFPVVLRGIVIVAPLPDLDCHLSAPSLEP